MTEIKETTGPLPAASRDFVLRWGEMGDRWGMNRSVAQVHALLYVAEQPLTAEDVALRLAMARSNVSTSLRELVAWRLIHRAGPDHAPASQAFGFRIRVADLLYVSPTGSR